MKYLLSMILFVQICTPMKSIAEEVQVKLLYSGVVKGSVRDYHPNIFKEHSLKIIYAVTDNPWAGKLYLMNNNADKNMAAATQIFYQGANKNMEQLAIAFCQGYLGAIGIKQGLTFVDNFDVTQIYEDGMAHYIISGNVMCFDK